MNYIHIRCDSPNNIQTVLQEGAAEDVTILLLGNKSDHAKRQIKFQEGEILAKVSVTLHPLHCYLICWCQNIMLIMKHALKTAVLIPQEYNFEFMECSAATGENVIQSLETVAR